MNKEKVSVFSNCLTDSDNKGCRFIAVLFFFIFTELSIVRPKKQTGDSIYLGLPTETRCDARSGLLWRSRAGTLGPRTKLCPAPATVGMTIDPRSFVQLGWRVHLFSRTGHLIVFSLPSCASVRRQGHNGKALCPKTQQRDDTLLQHGAVETNRRVEECFILILQMKKSSVT